MTNLADLSIDAHGGIDRLREFSTLTAKLHRGSVPWRLEGKPTVLGFQVWGLTW